MTSTVRDLSAISITELLNDFPCLAYQPQQLQHYQGNNKRSRDEYESDSEFDSDDETDDDDDMILTPPNSPDNVHTTTESKEHKRRRLEDTSVTLPLSEQVPAVIDDERLAVYWRQPSRMHIELPPAPIFTRFEPLLVTRAKDRAARALAYGPAYIAEYPAENAPQRTVVRPDIHNLIHHDTPTPPITVFITPWAPFHGRGASTKPRLGWRRPASQPSEWRMAYNDNKEDRLWAWKQDAAPVCA